MERIEITDEQHKKAIASPEGLETILNDVFAKAEQLFWKRADNIVCIMIQERMPFLKAIDVHLEGHPELKSFDFVGACFACRHKNPNRPVAEIITEAEELVKKKDDNEG